MSDYFIMRCQWPGLPPEQVSGSIQRLGENSDQAGRAPRWRLLEAR
jgi:hypothetical protein